MPATSASLGINYSIPAQTCASERTFSRHTTGRLPRYWETANRRSNSPCPATTQDSHLSVLQTAMLTPLFRASSQHRTTTSRQMRASSDDSSSDPEGRNITLFDLPNRKNARNFPPCAGLAHG